MNIQSARPLYNTSLLGSVSALMLVASLLPGTAFADAAVKDRHPANSIKEVNDNPNRFSFAVIADRTSRAQGRVFQEAMHRINQLRPAFIASVGDVIQGYTEDTDVVRAQWDEVDEVIGQLDMPFYLAPGNHDMTYKAMTDIYQERYGRPYYHVVYKDVLFLFVHTQDPYVYKSVASREKSYQELEDIQKAAKRAGRDGNVKGFQYRRTTDNWELRNDQITDAQMRYFRNVLDEHRDVRWTFVFMHKPLWRPNYAGDIWQKFERLFEGRRYTMIGGHNHLHSYQTIKGQDYIRVSTTGGAWGKRGQDWRPDINPGKYHHILWITMDGDEPVIANVLTDVILEETDIRPVK